MVTFARLRSEVRTSAVHGPMAFAEPVVETILDHRIRFLPSGAMEEPLFVHGRTLRAFAFI